jgi:hypothetical protein
MSKEDLANVDNLEIEALGDEELDTVAGGGTDVASCTCCVATAQTTVNTLDNN